MLYLITLLPAAGALLLQSFNEQNSDSAESIKKVTLIITILVLLLCTSLWSQFDSSQAQLCSTGYQFLSSTSATSLSSEFTGSIPVGGIDPGLFSLRLGVDSLSLLFILLVAFTMPICILASWDNVPRDLKGYMSLLLIIESLLLGVFMVVDAISFYVAFEAVLIPLFLIIGIWGASEARVRAGYLLFLYTLLGSLFMLLAFATLYQLVGSTNFEVLAASDLSFDVQRILWLAIFISFAVKTPLVPMHLWLIRAHVEASVAVSMILAGIVLKLATYGILRILIPVLPEASAYFAPLAMSLGVLSVLYGSLACLRQTDFKCLVAYSSVAHMGIVIIGLFSNTVIGLEGALMLSYAHGFVSPALFFIVGSVLYDRFHTRVIRYYRGLTVYMPVAMTLFFAFTLANCGVPLTANWNGEVLALAGSFPTNPIATSIAALSIVLSACYSIWLFNRLAFGSYSPYMSFTVDLSRREFIVLITLLFPTLYFGIVPNVLLADLHYFVSGLIYA